MQGGDFTSNGRGDGQMSIYGQKFEDENFLVKHDSLGTSMSKDYHNSYWYITTKIYFGQVSMTITTQIYSRPSFDGKWRSGHEWVAIFHYIINKPQHAR